MKLVRAMLETWNLVRKFAYICSFRKYTFQYQGSLNFVDVSIFFAQKSTFFGKNGIFPQSCVRDFLVLLSFFARYKVTVNENVSFTGYAYGIQLLDCSKLTLNWKNNSDVTICKHDLTAKFFNVVLFLLSVY